ncbi:MAG: uroporphyrinogen decarboxylase family protein [bacterium]
MTKRERLMATLQGEAVDRPAVSFYEIGGWKLNPDDPDPYNVCNAPGWRPLIELAEQETDLIRMIKPTRRTRSCRGSGDFFRTETFEEGYSRMTSTSVTVGTTVLTSLDRRDRDVSTTWNLEHLLKTEEDIAAFLQLPDDAFVQNIDLTPLWAAEAEVGDRGIVMVDFHDPLCRVATLFSIADYTVFAMTRPDLFHLLLEQAARQTWAEAEQVARAFPGHLWRLVGAEYASEPFLPPALFSEYWVRYTAPVIATIRRYGGFPRVHSHGRLRNILPLICAAGAAGLDPVEPPQQGDVELGDVRREYGRELVLFGNIEAADIENMPPAEFERKVAQALREGSQGEGHGFVLMPSACPYGRTISADTMRNYETMVRLAQSRTA